MRGRALGLASSSYLGDNGALRDFHVIIPAPPAPPRLLLRGVAVPSSST